MAFQPLSVKETEANDGDAHVSRDSLQDLFPTSIFYSLPEKNLSLSIFLKLLVQSGLSKAKQNNNRKL